MSKPFCKSEAKWKFFRDELKYLGKFRDKFVDFEKKMRRKARRRFLKKIKDEEFD